MNNRCDEKNVFIYKTYQTLNIHLLTEETNSPVVGGSIHVMPHLIHPADNFYRCILIPGHCGTIFF